MKESTVSWESLLAERAWLFRLARHLVPGTAEAEELASDVLADASVQPLPRRAGPRAWLRALAERQARLRSRRAVRRAQREARAARAESLPSALDATIAFEVQREVAAAVAALAEPYRTTLLLRYWENLPPREVARAMRCPVETVQTRTKRAHAQLRAHLDARCGGRREAWLAPLLGLQERAELVGSGSVGVGLAIGFGGKLAVSTLAAAALVLAATWLFRGEEAPPRDATLAALASEREVEEPAPRGAVERVLEVVGDAPPQGRSDGAPALAPRVVRGRLVADEDERPLAPTSIALRFANGEQDELAFRVEQDAELAFEASVAREVAEPIAALWISVEDRAPLRLRTELIARESADPRERVHDLGTLRVPRGTQYRGRVLDERGQPLAGAILLLPLSRMGWGSSRNPENLLADVVRVGVGDAAGAFELAERVVPDVMTSHLFAATERALGWVRIEPSRGGEPAPAEIVVRTRPSAALRVVVVDGAGARVPRAHVAARPRFAPIGVERGETAYVVATDPLLAARFAATSDADGVAHFAALPIGDAAETMPYSASSYDLRVEGPDAPDQPWRQIEVAVGTEREIELVLNAPRLVALEVAVRDELEAPIAGARIVASGLSVVEAVTDVAGRASLRVDAAHELHLAASAPRHASARRTLRLDAANESESVVLQLVRALPLEGRATDAAGEPAAGFALFLGQRHLATTDAQGSFRVAEFPVGPRAVVLALTSTVGAGWTGRFAPETVDASAGPVHFVLERRADPGLPLSFEVVAEESGAPLEPAEHMVWPLDASGSLEGYMPTVRLEGQRLYVEGSSGVWRVGVRSTCGRRALQIFNVPRGSARFDARVVLPPTGTLEVEIRSESAALPADLVLTAQLTQVDPNGIGNFAYAGAWEASAPQVLVGDGHRPSMQRLRVPPLAGRRFRLLHADTTQPIRITAHGRGIRGSVEVRAKPQTLIATALELQRAD